MTITNRWWERNNVNATAHNKLPLTTFEIALLQPTLNSAATLLRSRFYPMFTYEELDMASHSDIAWAEWTAEFVAWYDPISPTTPPQPDDLDDRIVATARLYPTRSASIINPTNNYNVTFSPIEGVVQSFAQRKPNPATMNAPALYVGMWVLDPSSFFYSAHTNVRFLWTCYSEALFGI